MTQTLYAHMNKIKIKKKRKQGQFTYHIYSQLHKKGNLETWGGTKKLANLPPPTCPQRDLKLKIG
jgi:hypothetical protein